MYGFPRSATTTPTVELNPRRSPLAIMWCWYPSSSATRLTRARVSGDTGCAVCESSARDAVATCTLAAAATSRSVTDRRPTLLPAIALALPQPWPLILRRRPRPVSP